MRILGAGICCGSDNILAANQLCALVGTEVGLSTPGYHDFGSDPYRNGAAVLDLVQTSPFSDTRRYIHLSGDKDIFLHATCVI